MDNFKAVNDTLGHMFGDEVPGMSPVKIRRKVRTSDNRGRVGGDEFIVFLRNICSLDTISKKPEIARLSNQSTVKPFRMAAYRSGGSIACIPETGRATRI